MKAFIDRSLYFFLCLLMWVIIFAGFSPGYYTPLVEGDLVKSNTIHFHAIIYTGWMLIFTVQCSLPMFGKTKLHRQLGPWFTAYAFLLIPVGLAVTFHEFSVRAAAGDMVQARTSFLPPLTDMMIYPPIMYAVYHYRRKPEVHKRLMILAGTFLIFPAAIRIGFLDLPADLPLLVAIWLSPIILALAHDAIFRRKLYLSYGLGLPLLALTVSRLAIIDTQFWIDTTNALARAMAA